MAHSNVLNPHPPEFDRFLHAVVGEDRNGSAVTVLSTLARLGLDPWHETAELVRLGHDAARQRLATLLARFRDVPALASDHSTIARDLSQLLPARPTSGEGRQHAALPGAKGRPGSGGVIWAVLWLLVVLLQMYLVGGSGAGGSGGGE
ncbi:hypothetical protein [Tritonibacter horizontis]|uniref:Uncharacterized protein n=1 Tax=Tritonibacter horizontis TaxID=1768241 RepID=A0A132C2F0_9RHOB|nr:hypothetical protein [Tritonibacter horizontis]KUP94696.1 hypothetical protein TRIHO_06220 [Tritonibacter horizontis]